MSPPASHERLRSLMEHHRFTILQVAELLNRTQATVRVWRSRSGASIPQVLLERLERYLKCRDQSFASTPEVLGDVIDVCGKRRVVIRCPYCGDEHWHSPSPGPRVAHCAGPMDKRHPDARLGYSLVVRTEVAV